MSIGFDNRGLCLRSSESWPLPQRLPRRSARVSYLRGPFKGKVLADHLKPMGVELRVNRCITSAQKRIHPMKRRIIFSGFQAYVFVMVGLYSIGFGNNMVNIKDMPPKKPVTYLFRNDAILDCL